MADMSVVELVTNAVPIVDWNRERLKIVKRDVLEWVNVTRKSVGLSPLSTLPRGFPGVGNKCVIANCLTELGPQVSTERTVFAYLPDDKIDHPQGVRNFITSFDAGMYPELEAA
jgi:hypothetical protein